MKSKPAKKLIFDQVLEKISLEQRLAVEEMADQPNPHLTDMVGYLHECGHEVTYEETLRWQRLRRVDSAGVKAKLYNKEAEEAKGLNPVAALEKMTLDLISDVTRGREAIDEAGLSPSDWAKILPNTSRVAITAVEFLARHQKTQNIQDAERAGAMRLAEGLRQIFAQSPIPYREALDKGITAILKEMLSVKSQ